MRKRFHSLNPVWGNFVQYRELFLVSRAAPNWRAALAVWFGPPQGWNEPVPHQDFTGFQRYQPEVSRKMRPVVLLQAAVLMAATVYYILMAGGLDWPGRLLCGGFILLASAGIGAQLEGRWSPFATSAPAGAHHSQTETGDQP